MSEVSVLGGKRLWNGEMEDAEWETIVENLRRAKKWEEMWELIFLAPVERSAEMVRTLHAEKWTAKEADRDVWEALTDLCPEEEGRLMLVDGKHIGSAHDGVRATVSSISRRLPGIVRGGRRAGEEEQAGQEAHEEPRPDSRAGRHRRSLPHRSVRTTPTSSA